MNFYLVNMLLMALTNLNWGLNTYLEDTTKKGWKCVGVPGLFWPMGIEWLYVLGPCGKKLEVYGNQKTHANQIYGETVEIQCYFYGEMTDFFA